MRLLDTQSRGFEEVLGQIVPPYAILLHSWEEEEVTYEDYIGGIYLGIIT